MSMSIKDEPRLRSVSCTMYNFHLRCPSTSDPTHLSQHIDQKRFYGSCPWGMITMKSLSYFKSSIQDVIYHQLAHFSLSASSSRFNSFRHVRIEELVRNEPVGRVASRTPRCQCYKTFYGRKLPFFLLS
jgi:hypothetical protein